MKSLIVKSALGLALAGMVAGAALANGTENNPYSPAYGHHYRHGVVPTRAVHKKMHDWKVKHAGLAAAATSASTLSYNGGTPSGSQGNVGVMNGMVKVYLVFYGSGWGSQSTDSNGDATFSGDPNGAAQAAQEMFKGIGTGGELWSADLTQWCQGISSGSQSCPAGTAASSFVPYMTGGILAGVWEDTSATTPINATGNQMAQEAIAAAQHFGNTTPASNRYAYYVIMSATGDDPDNYQSPTQGYCAWHDWNGDSSLSGGAVSSPVGDIAFSNQPYNIDQGSSCGVNFVNSGSAGTLDGYTMTLGHEWHETMSDAFPAGGWTNPTNGQENSDECAWIAAGSAGGAANVSMGTGTFTEQASWSNDTNNCAISHPIVNHGGGGNTPPTASNGSVTTSQNTAVNGTLSASDSDGDTLTFSVAGNPANGSVTITNTATGAFTYTPNSGFTGSDSFTFQATDSASNVSNTATVSVTVSTSGGGGGTFSSTDTPVTINDNATIQDVIPVSGQSGNGPATLKVTVNITHNWSGDLEIDLIAPDGTQYVLQSPDFNNDGNISQTYTVNASSVPANGNWTLQVIDNDPWFSGDFGSLDSWNLKF